MEVLNAIAANPIPHDDESNYALNKYIQIFFLLFRNSSFDMGQ
jgi:hypothetical protein